MRKTKTVPVFHIFLIKPTHYDDEGYPIIWKQTFIPSNSLAVLNGLCCDFKTRQVLGENVDVQITVIDEANTRVLPKRIARQLHKSGARGFVGMVGVQTNQFPRALDLSRQFIDCDIPVCIGGFHVSGYLATMKTLPEDVVAAQKSGISFFVGEGEQGRVDEVLCDAWHRRLKPLYDYLGEMPDISGAPLPSLPMAEIEKSYGNYAPFDLGRGCPFSCTFCTIINVHGQRSRFRTADDLERIVRDNYANGVRQFFLTDDNIARNKNWRAFFDRLHQMRKDGMRFRILAQVDTACHKIPWFIPLAVAAGIDQILVGLESMNPDNLDYIDKKQNKIEHYKRNLNAWKKFPVVITASYIIGLPHDTPERVWRDVALIKRELPVDALYFTNITPLPGSELHRNMVERGEWLDDDYNNYDTNHCVLEHPKMSREEWQKANKVAWETFYNRSHMETVIRRMVACRSTKKLTTIYRLAVNANFGIHSTIHPLDGGLFRKKYVGDRRPGMPREFWLGFQFRHLVNDVRSSWRFYRTVRRLYALWKKLKKDPEALRYTDEAISGITPIQQQVFRPNRHRRRSDGVDTGKVKTLMP